MPLVFESSDLRPAMGFWVLANSLSMQCLADALELSLKHLLESAGHLVRVPYIPAGTQAALW